MVDNNFGKFVKERRVDLKMYGKAAVSGAMLNYIKSIKKISAFASKSKSSAS